MYFAKEERDRTKFRHPLSSKFFLVVLGPIKGPLNKQPYVVPEA
jgi:hypothetical protein